MASEVYRATPELVSHVVDRVREADKVEFWHAGRVTVEEGVSKMLTQPGWVAVIHGEPVAVYGVRKRTPFAVSGMPWMVASREVEKVRRDFLAHGREELDRIAEGLTHLWGYVHEENRLAVRWLGWMGFGFPQTVEINGATFRQFEMTR